MRRIYKINRTREPSPRVYSYDPWGKITSESETVSNSIKYAGEYYDAENGLIYLRNRYYDPSIGRFTSEDPIEDGLNWYAYCENNPVMFVDPWGLNDCEVYLREMFDMYKQTKDDTIEVYDDRITVKLNNVQNTYYYNVNEYNQIDENRMNGDKMMVNAYMFAKRFNLVKTISDTGSKTYVFGFLETGGIPLLGTTTVNWHCRIHYVETPDKKIVISQRVYARMDGWTLPECEIGKPTLMLSNKLTYTQDELIKQINLKADNNPSFVLPGVTYSYVSTEKILFTTGKTVEIHGGFSLIHKNAIATSYTKNFNMSF